MDLSKIIPAEVYKRVLYYAQMASSPFRIRLEEGKMEFSEYVMEVTRVVECKLLSCGKPYRVVMTVLTHETVNGNTKYEFNVVLNYENYILDEEEFKKVSYLVDLGVFPNG